MAGCENKTQWTNSSGQPIGFPLPNWQRRPDPPRTPIEGRLCRLEQLNVDQHIQDLYKAFGHDSEGRNWTYMLYGPFQDYGSFQIWLKTESQSVSYAVIDKQTGRAVGTTSYRGIDPENGVIEVGGLNFSNSIQRTTIATEVIYLMMRRVFDELGYRRLVWHCNSLNAKSISAAKRYGFRFEGIFRQARVAKSLNSDTAWFSLIDSEWPRIKQAFERWLDPKNFNSEGTQREKLSDLTRH